MPSLDSPCCQLTGTGVDHSQHVGFRLTGSEAELAASLPLHITVRVSHVESEERQFCIAARPIEDDDD